jgi:indole-3-glycerol phosphate synthase
VNNFLEKIVRYKKKNIALKTTNLTELKKEASNKKIKRRSFKKALSRQARQSRQGISIIAEIKKASPSRGKITSKTIKELGRIYNSARADAVSVLCEDKFFLGSPADLKKVKSVYSGPVLMKDFIISEYQVYTGYINSADAILLIKAILSSRDYIKLYNLAQSLGMDVLVEVHSGKELDEVLKLKKPEIIGVNVRDLNTFEINPQLHCDLIKDIPADILKVAESSIKSRERAKKLKEAGYDALLVGESIASSRYPAKKIRELKNI